MSRSSKHRLGRGLGALLGEDYLQDDEGGESRSVPVDAVVPNPFQPRREFRDSELEDLARSIDDNGLLQPPVVRPAPTGDGRFELVAGERRLRALRRLGWTEVPVIVRDVDDRTLLVLALVENLQREGLSPVEEAEGYRALMDDFGLTQEEVAQSVSKNRSTVANTLRLLRLPPTVRRLLEEGRLSSGHARALLSLDDQGRIVHMARSAVRHGWSVREVEERVRKGRGGKPGEERNGGAERARRDPAVRRLQEELEAALGTRVRLEAEQSGKGTIRIPFRSPEDFERLFALITGREVSEVAG